MLWSTSALRFGLSVAPNLRLTAPAARRGKPLATLSEPAKPKTPKRSKPPSTLVEWGMDEELWSKIDNKRNFFKMVNRGEEEFARARIIKLRQMLLVEVAPTAGEPEESEVPMPTGTEPVAEAPVEDQDAASPDSGASDEVVLEVVCPELPAGRMIRIALPDGREFDVTVPEGIEAGATFRVGPFPRAEAGEAAEPEAAAEGSEPTKEERLTAADTAAAHEARAKRRLARAPRATMTASAVAAVQGLLAVAGGEDRQLAAAEARAAAVAAKEEEEDAIEEAALAAVVARIAEIEAAAAK